MGFFFIANFAVQPRQAQFQIFRDCFAAGSDRFVDFDGFVLSSNPFERAGQFRADVVGRVHGVDTVERLFGNVNISSSLLKVRPIQ